jgi:hypothetical protein
MRTAVCECARELSDCPSNDSVPTKIAVSRCKIRIEIKGALKMGNRFVGTSFNESDKPKRDVGPRVVAVELGSSGSQRGSFVYPRLDVS